jgi:hypothetical protein
MATLNVYWRMADFDPEEQAKHERRVVHTGVLTDEHQSATTDQPVLVEEGSDRVYRPGELPPESVLYIEDHPGPLPPLAEQARRAGFRVEYAGDDPGMTDRPRKLWTGAKPEEVGEQRRDWFPASTDGGEPKPQ